MLLSKSTDAGFVRYQQLLKNFYSGVQALIVFNNTAQIIWKNSFTEEKKLKSINSYVNSYQKKSFSEESKTIYNILSGDDYIELINLLGEYDEIVLTLCLIIRNQDGVTITALAKNDTVQLLNQGLLTEFQQGVDLDSKEDELNIMTDELTRRYEELNLVYKADDQVQNKMHGKELLIQMVAYTLNFLEVDLIYLTLPEKNLTLHRYHDDQLIFDTDNLFNLLQTDIYAQLKSINEAIVINQPADVVRFNLDVNLPYKFIVNPVVNADNVVIGLIAVVSRNFHADFTNSDRNLLEVMANKASKIVQYNFDPLTGLENSTSFTFIVKEALRLARKTDVSHAVANIDIDRLSVVNEIGGLEAGDLLIKKVGECIAGMVRARDVVARLGSDKFGVYLENCDLETAESVMSKIAQRVAGINLAGDNKNHEVSISIGIAPVTANSKSVTNVLNAAESAREKSKQHGRNKIQIFEMDDQELLSRQDKIRWVSRIQTALRDDRFVLYSQLIEPLDTLRDQPHYEILVRMRDKDGSIIAPGHFIPAAEHFFLMPRLDRWVIEQSFKQLAEYTADNAFPVCQISINLAGQSISDANELEIFIREKLAFYQLDASAICFEITESSAIANLEEAQYFISQIRSMGCTFSLDDFGTGLSSFAYLKNLPVNYLKIDGIFVSDIVDDAVAESMVSAINQVGHAMQLKTIAEYVENDDIKQKLIEIGVDFGQGYGLARPQLFDDQLGQLGIRK